MRKSKLLLVTLTIVCLVGCNEKQDEKDKVLNANSKDNICNKSSECLCIDENEKIMSVAESYPVLVKKLGEEFKTDTLIDVIGVEVHEKRIYYIMQTFVNKEYETNGEVQRVRQTVGNYAIDVYTAEVYGLDTGEYIKIK